MTYSLDKLAKKLGNVEMPPAEIDADLAIPSFKEDPQKLANKIKRLKEPLIKEVVVMGRYVNLKLNKEKLAKAVLTELKNDKDKYGHRAATKKDVVFIEYSSPNIAKQMHVGHLRNTVLGSSMKKIYEAGGYKVTSANYIGDWGTQFGLMLLAWQKSKNKKLSIENLGKLYTGMANKAEKNQKLADEAKELFAKLEKGDKELEKLWKKFRNVSLKEFKKVYKELHVSFDIWNGESFYKKEAENAINEALKKKVAKESEGAIAVDLEKYGLRSYLLKKSNGATLYSARDLAAAQWRLSKYKPRQILYVVGREQELYLKQIFKTLELTGKPANKLRHISYNLVSIAGKKASTRKGRIIFVKEILDEAKKKAKNKKIGYGAVIYNFLSQKRSRPIDFDWKKALNIKGDSAPYIQYGYVRGKAILKKNRETKIGSLSIKNLNEREGNLVMFLAKYPRIIEDARKLYEPHLIAGYLNDLVQEFNRFYENDPILKAPRAEKNFRLALTSGICQVIKNGLGLLGIDTPSKM